MIRTKRYYATPICRHDGAIDIAVRSPDDKIICTTLGLIGDDVIAAINEAYNAAKRIAEALNAQAERDHP